MLGVGVKPQVVVLIRTLRMMQGNATMVTMVTIMLLWLLWSDISNV